MAARPEIAPQPLHAEAMDIVRASGPAISSARPLLSTVLPRKAG
eukprot:CAMPEP_0182859208 /NCGR_PEP_ID=MMETSP0034_2-20130328/4154_1 /TAXON_ID=156128 /ORGANISM="Nephroselmis pyriformis, Strain CCMP717" /LENGTH=43 /DNA_ID= /DNA_START= /DNA_END= /DNA_ORIENTATION=